MRVLIITYHYPPSPAVGGLRSAGLVKYLPEFGHDPLVLTPEFAGRGRSYPEVVETGYRDVLADLKAKLRLDPRRSVHQQFKLSEQSSSAAAPWHSKVLNFAASCIAYPDPYKGWTRFAIDAIRKFQTGPRIDVILSSAPPATSAMIAAQAKALLRCPWIADFRDLWVDNLAATTPPVLRRMQRRLEKKTLSAADALVTVSEPWANRLRQSYPSKSVTAITNGFDPADFAGDCPPLTPFFSITYTGQLYQGKRDPSPLLQSLQQLFAAGLLDRRRVRVRFYGPREPWLAAAAQQFGVQDVVQIEGPVTRSEALQRQRESQLLLQLGWADTRETGQHTGKLFEYLGTRRPILAVGGVRGVMTELLQQTGAGVHALSAADLCQFLAASYRQFEHQGLVAYGGNPGTVEQYTQREMARKMSAVITRAVS